ncbi:MAG: response regulator, partial [Delftia acidovorans]|nr:response regulator [Delftia acidovorans]
MSQTDRVKCLIVDDIAENLIAIEALLQRDGIEFLKAHSGPEALELLLDHGDVALALLDVQMPEMNGFELAELIRGSERTRHSPLIFMTAGSREHNWQFRGYESGAVDFLYKPIDP